MERREDIANWEAASTIMNLSEEGRPRTLLKGNHVFRLSRSNAISAIHGNCPACRMRDAGNILVGAQVSMIFVECRMKDPKDVTILVVDDEPALRDGLRFDFEKKNFKVVTASNGTEALSRVIQNPVDVVLTDMRMAGGGGIELLDRIKEIDIARPIVILLTGFVDISLDKVYAKGAAAIFLKPFNRKELFSAVLKAITPVQEAWQPRDSEPTHLDISLELDSLNLGRGGIFVPSDKPIAPVDSRVSFHILFKTGAIKRIDGIGIVRWVRSQSQESDPRGYGIEFESIDHTCRDQVIEAVQQLKTMAFIPQA